MKKTREWMRPVVVLINAMIEDVQTGALRDHDEALEKALHGLVYAGDNVFELAERLGRFARGGIGYQTRYPYRRLMDLLPLLSVLEDGGLDGVNRYLAEYLNVLRSDLTRDALEEALGAVNGILFGAIQLFPHLATGIKVRLSDKVRSADEIRQLLEYDSKRGSHEAMLQLYPQETGREHDGTFILPLPFAFTTGTHGSGERAAYASSRAEIFLSSTPGRRGDGSHLFPVLNLVIRRPLLTFDYTKFLLDEVESVEFIAGGSYSPYYSQGFRDHEPKPEALIERGSHLEHYLSYRGFVFCLLKRESFEECTDDEWSRCWNLRIPSLQNIADRLWERDYRRRHLTHGFLAVKGDASYTLYEVTDVSLDNDDSFIGAAMIYLRILRREKAFRRDKVRVYGRDRIIAKLLKIPVAERQF